MTNKVVPFKITVEDTLDNRKKDFELGGDTQKLLDSIQDFLDEYNNDNKNRFPILFEQDPKHTMYHIRIAEIISPLKDYLEIEEYPEISELNELIIAHGLSSLTEEETLVIQVYMEEKPHAELQEAIEKTKASEFVIYNCENEDDLMKDVVKAKYNQGYYGKPSKKLKSLLDFDWLEDDLKRNGNFLINRDKKIVIEFID